MFVQLELVCNLPELEVFTRIVEVAVNSQCGVWRDSPDSEESLRAKTCTELATDLIASCLEVHFNNKLIFLFDLQSAEINFFTRQVKIRHHGPQSKESLDTLVDCLASNCRDRLLRDGETVERALLNRCLSLVFQRLCRSVDSWSISMVDSLEHIFAFIEQRCLCGQIYSAMPPVSQPQPDLLLDMDFAESVGSPAQVQPVQSDSEQQLMFFIVDMATSIRKASEKCILGGSEGKLLRLCLAISLSCVRSGSEAAVERICGDVLAFVEYFIGQTKGVSPEKFRTDILFIFQSLQASIHDSRVPVGIHDRCRALVFSLCYQFIRLREDVTSGTPCRRHWQPAVDCVQGFETCKDAEMIFRLVEINFCTASTICFDEVYDLPDAAEEQHGEPLILVDSSSHSHVSDTQLSPLSFVDSAGAIVDMGVGGEGDLLEFEAADGDGTTLASAATPALAHGGDLLLDSRDPLESVGSPPIDPIPSVASAASNSKFFDWLSIRQGETAATSSN